MTDIVHPAFVLLLAAGLLPFLNPLLRTAIGLLSPCLALYLLWQLPEGVIWQTQFLYYPLEILRVDALSRLFATVFCIMAFTGVLFACRQARVLELTAALIYAAAALGAVLAGDLISLFICWEIMALGSTLVIWSADSEKSRAAGLRYVLLHLLGGVVLMAGIVAYVHDTGSLRFDAMQMESLATGLILAGFLLNAAAPPFSAWVTLARWRPSR